MSNIGSALPFVADHKVFFSVSAILLVMAINLRGVRESGVAFAIPTYAFIVGVGVMLGWGLFRIYLLGDPLRAESPGFEIHAQNGKVVGFALAFLVARSFSSGCAALTGVEAISNGVPAFRTPKSRNAATTLLMLGTIA
jgi:amino acid transporter